MAFGAKLCRGNIYSGWPANRERFEFVNAFLCARVHVELLFRDFHGHTLNLASPPQQIFARPLATKLVFTLDKRWIGVQRLNKNEFSILYTASRIDGGERNERAR